MCRRCGLVAVWRVLASPGPGGQPAKQGVIAAERGGLSGWARAGAGVARRDSRNREAGGDGLEVVGSEAVGSEAVGSGRDVPARCNRWIGARHAEYRVGRPRAKDGDMAATRSALAEIIIIPAAASTHPPPPVAVRHTLLRHPRRRAAMRCAVREVVGIALIPVVAGKDHLPPVLVVGVRAVATICERLLLCRRFPRGRGGRAALGPSLACG